MQLSEQAFEQLRWRARRGLLENDVVMARFFERYRTELSLDDAKHLMLLLDLSDPDLLDLILAKRNLPEAIDHPKTRELLLKLQNV